MVTKFDNGSAITSRHAVLTTNGQYLSHALAGILVPCWSYFVALPHPRDPLVDKQGTVHPSATRADLKMNGYSSHNYMTYGFNLRTIGVSPTASTVYVTFVYTHPPSPSPPTTHTCTHTIMHNVTSYIDPVSPCIGNSFVFIATRIS